MSAIFDFLKGGIACVFAACIITSLLMLAGFILCVIFFPVIKLFSKDKKEPQNEIRAEKKQSFALRHLYKILLAILFVNAVIFGLLCYKDESLLEGVSVSVVAYVSALFSGAIVYGAMLGIVSLIEKMLSRYVELKNSLKSDFEASQIPMWVCVFIGFCVFSVFMPK